MLKFYLFEAGASKTTFVKVLDQGTEEMILPPFNANRDFTEFADAVQNQIEIEKGAIIYFYGSGCGNDENKMKVRELFAIREPSKLEVHDDIIAAAHSSFRNEPGVITILGTGGVAAFFDGEIIKQRRGGYGYLLGDLGGGLELGKKFINLWLNGDLSQKAEGILKDKLGLDKKTFVQQYYLDKDISLPSNLTPFVLQFEYEDSVERMLEHYFNEFVEFNVLPLCKAEGVSSFSAVGSIAYYFKHHLEKAAKSFGLELTESTQDPIKGLLAFHNL
jgi:glucosamine kinase